MKPDIRSTISADKLRYQNAGGEQPERGVLQIAIDAIHQMRAEKKVILLVPVLVVIAVVVELVTLVTLIRLELVLRAFANISLNRTEYYLVTFIELFFASALSLTLVFGLGVEIVRRKMHGDRQPIRLLDWTSGLVPGLKIAVIYSGFVAVGDAILNRVTGGALSELLGVVQAITGNDIPGLLLYKSIVFVLLLYAFPAIVLLFAPRNRLRDLLPFGQYKTTLLNRHYARMALATMIYTVLVAEGATIVLIDGIINPVVGSESEASFWIVTFLGPAILIPAYLLMFYIIGEHAQRVNEDVNVRSE